MKAIFIRKYGGNQVIEFGELPAPKPGPGQLLVEICAAGVNPVDFKIRDGKLKLILPLKFPLILGNEISGMVRETGSGVRRFKPGDAVFGRLGKLQIGAFAEFAVIDEAHAAFKPAKLTHVQAAAVPLAALTAWQALFDIGRLQSGQCVLIHGGSGGVGTFAIQLAKHAGARVATTVGARNAKLAHGLGADVVIDYATQRFEDLVQDCDLVFDTHAGEIQHRSFGVLRRGGTLVSIAGIPDRKTARTFQLNPLLGMIFAFMNRKSNRLATQKDVHFEYLFMQPSGEQLAQIAGLLDSGVLRTVIDRVFPLAQAQDALAYSEAGHATGKVVIQVRDP